MRDASTYPGDGSHEYVPPVALAIDVSGGLYSEPYHLLLGSIDIQVRTEMVCKFAGSPLRRMMVTGYAYAHQLCRLCSFWHARHTMLVSLVWYLMVTGTPALTALGTSSIASTLDCAAAKAASTEAAKAMAPRKCMAAVRTTVLS